jgi:hypothetical protein
MMGIFNTNKTKLVLLLTAYGSTNIKTEEEVFARILRTSSDTFEFAAKLDATENTTVCENQEPRIGGTRRRKRSKRSTKRFRHK